GRRDRSADPCIRGQACRRSESRAAPSSREARGSDSSIPSGRALSPGWGFPAARSSQGCGAISCGRAVRFNAPAVLASTRLGRHALIMEAIDEVSTLEKNKHIHTKECSDNCRANSLKLWPPRTQTTDIL